MKSYSPYQFSFFRIILGLYLTIHFCLLLPYAIEIWSNIGILPEASLNLTHGYFPNLLNHFDDPWMVQVFVVGSILLSILFTLGVQRQFVALLLWYAWVCLFDRNNLISNPGIPFIGWLLLCCICIPKGEPLSFSKRKQKRDWQFPIIIYIGAWVIMALSYSLSGLDKMMAPSWQDGTALFHLLENPLARNWWFRETLLSLPMPILQLMTWGILVLEILFLPLCIFTKNRKWVWITMVLMHLGILLIIDFADLTLGMLMIHWFTFDSRWLKAKSVEQQTSNNIVFYDGVCGMCNQFVQFLLREDRSNVLQFAALQGQTAAATLSQPTEQRSDSILYFSDEQTWEKSDAVIKMLSHVGGIWKLVNIFKVIPKKARDVVYDFVAKHRYKFSPATNQCELLDDNARNKILD